MTDADFRNQVAKLVAEAPRATPLPKRSELDVRIDRLTWYLRTSATVAARTRYARELLAARKERGDDLSGAPLSAGIEAIEKAQAEIIQTPERAREALREKADLPGERYD